MALNVHPQELMKLTKILHGKLLLHSRNDASEEVREGSCADYVINIQEQICHVEATTKHEQVGVRLGFHKPKGQQEGSEPAVPSVLKASPRRLGAPGSPWVIVAPCRLCVA